MNSVCTVNVGYGANNFPLPMLTVGFFSSGHHVYYATSFECQSVFGLLIVGVKKEEIKKTSYWIIYTFC